MTDVFASGEDRRALDSQWSSRDAERERTTLPDSPYTRDEHKERQAIAFGRAWLDEQCNACREMRDPDLVGLDGRCETCRKETP